MRVWFSVSWDASRQLYRARFRIPKTEPRTHGTPADQKVNVPESVFKEANIPRDRQSDKAERLAYKWASREAEKMQSKRVEEMPLGPPAMSLEQMFALYKRRNPGSVIENAVFDQIRAHRDTIGYS